MEPKTYKYTRRRSHTVRIGGVTIGDGNPVAVQSMTDTDTNDTTACVAQIGRIRQAGGRIVRLTAQGVREGENLREIADQTHRQHPDTALVADIHFLPRVAAIAAQYVHKVRINPGNYNDKGGDFDALLELCSRRGVALRVGVNHGSLAERMMDLYGDTPRGMVESAMEFLRRCRERNFDQVVVSMKSSNTRIMVHAYRLLVGAMDDEDMTYPIHLGVTEAGDAAEGRVKSAVGIGALLADGIGDTIRVSLTEPPENEIPVALALTRYFDERLASTAGGTEQSAPHKPSGHSFYDPLEYSRRATGRVGRLGDGNAPLLWSELTDSEKAAVDNGEAVLLTAVTDNPVAEWRAAICDLERAGNPDRNHPDRRPVILRREYDDTAAESLMIKAAADFGVMFIDGLADGIDIRSTTGIPQEMLDDIALNILQASRARISRTEFIACPGCGRTLYDLHRTLGAIKSRTGHLRGLKIGVMGCIVNGPGEMADADYGYVGAAPGHISLYRGREVISRNIPQAEALDALVELIKSDGRWVEP